MRARVLLGSGGELNQRHFLFGSTSLQTKGSGGAELG